jgi:hypothetical protein
MFSEACGGRSTQIGSRPNLETNSLLCNLTLGTQRPLALRRTWFVQAFADSL